MNFVSFKYNVFLLLCVCLYYLFPQKYRWIVLLGGSFLFYSLASKASIAVLLFMIIISYVGGRIIEKNRKKAKKKQKVTLLTICTSLFFLLLVFRNNAVTEKFFTYHQFRFMGVLGISFFSMQMVAYLVDIYYGKIDAQRNFCKYALFCSFFPQIIQGPIPRYAQLEHQLWNGNYFEEKNLVKGFQMIIWGFFLKFMIADKSAIVVNTIFSNYEMYKGCYVLIAGVLYSVQLYADFMACVCLAKGAAQMFGIELTDNFRQPYFADSIKEFWRRWHITLSSWLRDYIYVPLGGNRKGRIKQKLNLILTFLFSGIWHGFGLHYLLWGVMHAMYQIVGESTYNVRKKIYEKLGFGVHSGAKRICQQLFTLLS